ncbi:hypothetical protein HJG60_008703 [Phyllostomus discolor]|uniref:Uncharacterized protein n=1 Tax=Phyllostomus discolor TaxID=89673 RepID=A0A834DFT3_9CHIR|nr:hypothetical protein HJG60_008703 [Phyllostomus discolor]
MVELLTAADVGKPQSVISPFRKGGTHATLGQGQSSWPSPPPTNHGDHVQHLLTAPHMSEGDHYNTRHLKSAPSLLRVVVTSEVHLVLPLLLASLVNCSKAHWPDGECRVCVIMHHPGPLWLGPPAGLEKPSVGHSRECTEGPARQWCLCCACVELSIPLVSLRAEFLPLVLQVPRTHPSLQGLGEGALTWGQEPPCGHGLLQDVCQVWRFALLLKGVYPR